MTDFIDMTKAELAAIIGGMTANQIKKASHADLVQKAGEKGLPKTQPTEPTLAQVLDGLTDLEKRVIVAHLDAGIDCNGAETLDAMRADNMTWADVAEVSNRTGLTKNQLKGVIASLSTKGLLSTDNEKPNGQPGVDQVLTDWGVVVGFELMADGIVANPGPAPVKAAPAQKPAKADKAPAAPKVKAAPKPRVVEDRIIVAPANDLKMVRPTGEGSKRHLLAQALLRGATIEHLMEVTGWNKSTATSALRWDIPQMGLGVRREGEKYFLILPAGVNMIPVRAKDMTRADALVAACK